MNVAVMVLSAIQGYLFGSINFGVVVSRVLYHEDIRTKGSGNAGATNILRTYGKKAAILTLAGDIGKGVVAVLVAQFLAGWLLDGGSAVISAGYVASIAAVCGHLWPVWFGFKGGKGVAVAAGAILAAQPVVFLGLVVIFFLCAFASKIVSLSSIVVAAVYPVFTYLWSMYAGNDVVLTTSCAAVMGVMVIWMHRANIKRLIAGTEYKFGQKKN